MGLLGSPFDQGFTVRPTVHKNPDQKTETFANAFLKPDEFENTGFASVLLGTENILKTEQVLENDDSVVMCFSSCDFLKHEFIMFFAHIKRKGGVFKVLRFDERFRKAPFS